MCGNIHKYVSHACLTIRLTEPPIFLVSISSPFMQSLKKKCIFLIPLQFHDIKHPCYYVQLNIRAPVIQQSFNKSCD